MQRGQSQDISFSEFFKQRRRELDLTQRELAAGANCSIDTVKKIEAGRLKPSRQLADLLASALQIAPPERATFVEWARAPSQVLYRLEEADRQVYAKTAEGGADSGRTSSTSRTNLPFATTSFVGREKEIDEVRSFLRRADLRLLTLLGAPGIGKTRLAIEAAAGLHGSFDGGVYLVRLASLNNPDLMVYSIAEVLGILDSGTQPMVQSLTSALQYRTVLLVLDNFEHLMPAAPLVSELLASVSGLKVLVTSREALHLYGEHELSVPPLPLPDPEKLTTVEDLLGHAAVDLFVQRVRASKSDFALSMTNAEAVARICVQLEGLPLAIELGAARLKFFGTEGTLKTLGHRLTFLMGGPQDVPARHRALLDTIEWSYRLLTSNEQQLLRTMSVFAGGCTPEAVEQCTLTAPEHISEPDGLQSLVQKSLLTLEGGTTGEVRFSMLETVREFSLLKLLESAEAEEIRRRHLHYYLSLAEKAEPDLRGTEQVFWLDRLEVEHSNIRAAFEWSQGPSASLQEADNGLLMAGILLAFIEVRGHLAEWRTRLDQALARATTSAGLQAYGRARAEMAAGRLAWFSRDYNSAEALINKSIVVLRKSGDVAALVLALEALGLVYGHRAGTSDYEKATAVLTEALALRSEHGQVTGLAETASFLLYVEVRSGNYTRAHDVVQRYLALVRALGDARGLAVFIYGMTNLKISVNDYAGLGEYFRESIALCCEIGEVQGLAWNIAGVGELALHNSDLQTAGMLFGAADRMLRSIGMNVEMHALDPSRFAARILTLRHSLGEDAFLAAWEHGTTLSESQALSLTLAACTSSTAAVKHRAEPDDACSVIV